MDAASTPSHGRVSPETTMRRPVRSSPTMLGRAHDGAVGELDILAALQPPEQRSLGHAPAARLVDVEAARAVVLDQRPAERAAVHGRHGVSR